MTDAIDLTADGVTYPITVRLGQGGRRGELLIDPDRFTLRWRPRLTAFLKRDGELSREGKSEEAMDAAADFLVELLAPDNPHVNPDWVLDHVRLEEVMPLITFFSNPAASLASYSRNPETNLNPATPPVGAESAAVTAEAPRQQQAA